MPEEKSLESIYKEITEAREKKTTPTCSAKEIAENMLVVIKQLEIDLSKYLAKNGKMEAPAKRVRTGSKILETLGKGFRVQSVKARKHGNG